MSSFRDQAALQIPFLIVILKVFLVGSAILDFKEVFSVLRISRLISNLHREYLMFSLQLETVFEVAAW